MKYDFDKMTNRFSTNSLKWDVKENELPMWVADMDFEVAPCIMDAINKRIDNKIFGYNIVSDEWYDTIISWWERRHHYKIEREWMMFSTGVVPTISSVVRKLTTPNENIVILTPVYNIFFNSIINNGRHVLECPLKYENNQYSINFKLLEEYLADPQTTMLIFCNPHNPIGKIWTKEEMAEVGRLCKLHNVIVVSDEIHCDITDPNVEYIPFQSVSDDCKYNSIMCIAPTKCFNIAGMQTSAIVVPSLFLKNKVNRGINTDEVAEPNTLATVVSIAAFKEGEDWINELNEYIYNNKVITKKFIDEEIKDIKLVKSNATYLLWLDCERITDDSSELVEFIREKTGLYLSSGGQYGKSGEKFIRMNIACPKDRLMDGLKRLKIGIELYNNK